MKTKLIAVSALTISAGAVFAGTTGTQTETTPQMEVEVITQDMAGAMTDSWVVPGIFALILILVLSGGATPLE